MKYVCSICGYEHIGMQPPSCCPVCKAPEEIFQKRFDASSSDPKNVEPKNVEPKNVEPKERFEVVDSQYFSGTDYVEVFRDKQTGIHYLWRKNRESAGLTVMLDRDGKPLMSSYQVHI